MKLTWMLQENRLFSWDCHYILLPAELENTQRNALFHNMLYNFILFGFPIICKGNTQLSFE